MVMSRSVSLSQTIGGSNQPRKDVLFGTDLSISMLGDSIEEVRQGLEAFVEALQADPIARKRAEVGIVAFGGTARMLSPFRPAEEFKVPELTPMGGTPMASAILLGLSEIRSRVSAVKASGLYGGTPTFALFTDGESTEGQEADQRAAAEILSAQRNKEVVFAIYATRNANLEKLKAFCLPGRRPFAIERTQILRLFQMLAESTIAGTKFIGKDEVQLPDVRFLGQ